jgi:hypothetical protein
MLQLWIAMLLASGQERVLESAIPGADAGVECTSSVEVVNVGSRQAAVELEAHGTGGALVALQGAVALVLAPRERRSFAVDSGAWVKVRERIALAEQGPVIAARGTEECRVGDRLQTVRHEAAFPVKNPWFAGDVSPPGGKILMINAGEQPVRASACYSMGNIYSLPGEGREPAIFEPVCSESFEVQVPPFGTRDFEMERHGNRWFGLKTRGPSIVLQMLRPVEGSVKMFVVDSTIRFGSEVTSQ